MTTIELISTKKYNEGGKRLKYSDFTSGDEFSILFAEKTKLYIYDSINDEPEEYDLDSYEYIVINHYIHYTIEEMKKIYKEYIDSERIINSSRKFNICYNEKMGLEKLKDCLTDNWRKGVVEKLYGPISDIESQLQQNVEKNKNNSIPENTVLNNINQNESNVKK